LTPKAGGPVDKERPTQVGRALARLGIEHIPAYSPEARGRSERMFGTLQDRLPKELKLAGIDDLEAANCFIREVYLAAHNACFARPAQIPESAFVLLADPTSLADILCTEEERVVARDNTITYAGRQLQLPQSPLRAHYVKSRVKLREYPDRSLAVFHGPRRIARYDAEGTEIAAVPTTTTVTPCSPASRRGLATATLGENSARRPALTPTAPGVRERTQGGTKKRAFRSNKETRLGSACP